MTLLQETIKKVYSQNGRWKISVQRLGIRKTFYSGIPGDKGRKECAAKAIQWITSDSPNTLTIRTTVDELFAEYLQDKGLETTDVYNIQNRYNNHIKPVIGRKSIMMLTHQDLKRVITTAYSAKGLSYKTLLNLRGDLSGFCNYLDNSEIRHDLRTSNIKIPRNAKKSHKSTLNAEQLYTLFTATDTVLYKEVREDDLLFAYRFQVVTGLRPGELMGLQWGDITDTAINIRRAINAKGIETTGKNDFAARSFPQTQYTQKILAAQEKYRSNDNDPTERVFGDTGQLCYRERWGKFCKYNDIPYITPYELRHTFASINKMLPLWVLDELMGHVHEGMSLGVYAHALDGDMDDIATQLDANIDKLIQRGKSLTEKC